MPSQQPSQFPDQSEDNEVDALQPDLSPVDWTSLQRKRAVLNAIDGLESNPDDAARALDLSKATGAPSGAIYDDLDNAEPKFRAAAAASIVGSNPYLRDY